MRWNDLLSAFSIPSAGGGNPEITDVTGDSRSVTSGALYVSIPGFKLDGDAFIPDAVKRGAAAVISQREQPSCPVPWARVENTRKMLGLLSRKAWGVDISKTLFVGITGTNGKTTTAYLFQNLLGGVFGEGASWMFGTVAYSMNGLRMPAHRTTPEAADIFRAMGQAKRPPRAVVMETSSHSLALDRVAGILYDCALWTNLTQDHLDYHKTMDEYYRAKKLLFTDYLKTDACAVVNIDDPWGNRLAEELADISILTYGKSERADVRIVESDSSPSGTGITLQTPRGPLRFRSKLSGYFNVYNMTALAAGALALSVETAAIQRCFETMETVPGRMERVACGAGLLDFSGLRAYAGCAGKCFIHGKTIRIGQTHLRFRLRRRTRQRQAAADGRGGGALLR